MRAARPNTKPNAKSRVWDGIIDVFGRGEIDPLLGARRKDMPGIFDDERRGSGPIAPDPYGTGPIFARAASRTAHGAPPHRADRS